MGSENPTGNVMPPLFPQTIEVPDTRYYQVKMAAGEDGCSHCGAGKMWAIVYVEHGQTEETEVGQTFGDHDLAEDICDLMNMAYESALECIEPYSNLLSEAENMAALGDIHEDTEAYGWGKWMAATRELLGLRRDSEVKSTGGK